MIGAMKMTKMKMIEKIKGRGEGDKICINCQFILWMVGVGQGIRCSKHRNENDFPRLIECGRGGYCDLFQRKPNHHITIEQIYGKGF